MKRNFRIVRWITWSIVLWSFLMSSISLIAGERVIVNGIVKTTKDSNGNLLTVKLDLKAAGEEVFTIVLDESGKRLGKEMEGKWVEVIGEVSIANDKKCLKVKSYKKFEEEF